MSTYNQLHQLQAKEKAPPNRTGMPDHLKSGLENISGMDLSGVRVHYNSSKPEQFNALAYTRGQEIHVGPGQEKHLPHEGWHVVQQMQGRVKPTMQMKDGIPVNDDEGLEHEADLMGTKALQMRCPDQVTTGVTAEPMESSEVSSKVIGATGEKVRSGVVQRDVIRDGTTDEVLLDRFNRDSEIAQEIAQWIFTNRYRKSEFVPAFDDLFDVVEVVLRSDAPFKADIVDPNKSIPLSRIGFDISSEIANANLLPSLRSPESSHLTWLFDESHEYLRQAKQEIPLLALTSHDEALNQEEFEHFQAFDTNMIWRFSSTPTAEKVFVTENTSYAEVLRVIAAHSGGNDKSNPKVKTLSFGRNIGALMGTALSIGGDKHVTNIIDKAEYLVGIDINSLPSLGISAHPAQGRPISLFEIEYILVNSPGNPARSLRELATTIYRNPFKRSQRMMLALTKPSAVNFEMVEREMGVMQAEVIKTRAVLPHKLIWEIVGYAKAVSRVASGFSSLVRSKEQIHPDDYELVKRNMLKYIMAIKQALST